MTPLATAIKDGDTNKINDLISSDNINERDPKWGWTPLHYAVSYNQIDAVKFLIKKGANVHIADEQGDTPLLLAAWFNNKDTINVLVDSGADINIRNRNGSTALIVAIQAGQIEIARMLIEKGADVHIVDSYGHKASYYVYHLQKPLIKRILNAEDDKPLQSFLKLLKDTEAEQVPIVVHETMQPECTQIPVQEIFPEERERAKKIAILPARFLPETDAINFAKMSGIARGALGGAAIGAQIGMTGFAGGGLFGLLLFPITTTGGLVVGTVVGVVSGDSKEEALEKKKALEMENETKKVLLELKIQETMARYIQAAGKRETDRDFIVDKDAGPSSPGDKPDYTALVKQGIDTVLEIAVKKIGSARFGEEKADVYYFYMIVQARLVRGTELFNQEFKYIIGPPRHYSQWVKAGADALQKEVEKAYEALAEDIVEFMFLCAYFEAEDSPLSRLYGTGHVFEGTLRIPVSKMFNTRYILGSLSGLTLEYPEPPDTPRFPSSKTLSYERKFVNTLQPTLRWEAFPTAEDIRVDRKGIVNRISNVTYDLRVWLKNGKAGGELIYEKKGLKDNNHKMECSLKSATNYLWTVRARFRLDDQNKATRWATFPGLFGIDPVTGQIRGYGKALFAGSIPVVRSYYPFMTRAEYKKINQDSGHK
jgi:predicted Fe-Mo cluster-binding NifX family protein